MIERIPLGTTPDGHPVTVFELSCGNARVRLMDLGASLFGFDVPARDGALTEIVLGYDDVASYLASGACFGATVGPSANRSDAAEVIVDGHAYQLPKNDGPDLANNLHTDGQYGLHKRVWNAEVLEGQNAVRFTCELADGEFGLPGARTFSALYTLRSVSGAGANADAANEQANAVSSPVADPDTSTASPVELTLEYGCTTDSPTFVNMTNHSYFNLAGHGAGSVLGHEVQINAQSYLPLREDSVSRGDVVPVAGTPFDFRTPKALGADIEAADEQLAIGRGYDHCFCIDGYKTDAPVRPALTAYDPASGRELKIGITTPGAHLYTGNWFDGSPTKGGTAYQPRNGFAFEPEFWPDNSHHASWEHPVCTPDHPFKSLITYTVGVR